jgi:hypothetical protein
MAPALRMTCIFQRDVCTFFFLACGFLEMRGEGAGCASRDLTTSQGSSPLALALKFIHLFYMCYLYLPISSLLLFNMQFIQLLPRSRISTSRPNQTPKLNILFQHPRKNLHLLTPTLIFLRIFQYIHNHHRIKKLYRILLHTIKLTFNPNLPLNIPMKPLHQYIAIPHHINIIKPHLLHLTRQEIFHLSKELKQC